MQECASVCKWVQKSESRKKKLNVGNYGKKKDEKVKPAKPAAAQVSTLLSLFCGCSHFSLLSHHEQHSSD